jgi:heterodisulfide reductase subunit A
VEEKRCIGCGQCVSACTYGAIAFREIRQEKKAVVNPVLCKGDGLCNAKCPTGAIQLKHFTDEELLAQIDAAAEVYA